MRFIPINGQVVVKRTSSEKVSRGGIVIPDSAQKESQIGTVLAACLSYTDANGKTCDAEVKTGDTVLFPKYDGEEINLPPWGNVLLMRHTSVRGIILDYNVVSGEAMTA